MSSIDLPDRPSLEYLKKLAKERLRELRRTNPDARLTAAQLAIARDYGFPNWRALKAEVERRRAPLVAAFFAACATGDVGALRDLLGRDPGLARERSGDGATGLHRAVSHPQTVRLLLEHGADPNARDVGDNALPLHFAAGGAPVDSVRALLDAGSDVHGFGDAHRLEVIGWATVFAQARRDVVDLLIERGARHHVFSAIALGDLDLLQRVVEENPEAITRRLSRFEQEQTALHYVIAPPDGLVAATVAWYQSIGFQLAGSHGEGGAMDWASVKFGDAEVMFVPSSDPWRGQTSALSLWIRTDRLDELYSLVKRRQLDRARAAFSGEGTNGSEVRFTVDLYTAFYGQREFGIRDPNGVELMFYQPLE